MRLKPCQNQGVRNVHAISDQEDSRAAKGRDFSTFASTQRALGSGMHLAIHEIQKTTGRFPKGVPAPASRDYASEEIYGYVAARDALLIDAEEEPTETAVKRAHLANEFVVNCLRPPQVPYGSQFLAEQDATRELQRCREASARLAALNNR
jgi:hypothetical protein